MQAHKLETWSDVLEELYRCEGQITDYGHPVGQILFDPTLRVGTSQRIEPQIFDFLREQGWIETPDQGRVCRFTISDAGIARLNLMAYSAG